MKYAFAWYVIVLGISACAIDDGDDGATTAGDLEQVMVGVQECKKTEDCPEGQICQERECRLAQCSRDEDCTNPSSVCSDGLCVISGSDVGDDDKPPACKLGEWWQICWSPERDFLSSNPACYFDGVSPQYLDEGGCTPAFGCATVPLRAGAVTLNCQAGEGEWPNRRWAAEYVKGPESDWYPTQNGNVSIRVGASLLKGKMRVVNTGTPEEPIGNLQFTPESSP